MRKIELEWIWSILKIEIDTPLEYDFKGIFKIVEDFENKYSRFKDDSLIWQLNLWKKIILEKEFETLIKLGLKFEKLTNWAFDITVWSALNKIWYDKNYSFKEKSWKIKYWSENIVFSESEIYLKNWIKLDIWGFWKWYIIDKIYNELDKKFDKFIIDFGGDIRCKWVYKIWIQSPIDDEKIIWEIELENSAVCFSSNQYRKFWNKKHLINSKNGKAIENKLGVCVIHKLATFADIFATSLFLMDEWDDKFLLEKTPNLQWIFIYKSGVIYTSVDFFWILY
jgi:thiamine biosynthesis lipoprotein ApbE